MLELILILLAIAIVAGGVFWHPIVLVLLLVLAVGVAARSRSGRL